MNALTVIDGWTLVTPRSPLAKEITNAERRWQREYGGSVERGSWEEGWLCGYTPVWDRHASGYATFQRGPGVTEWELYRVWLEPMLRRRGRLTSIWPAWRERYGDFGVVSPNDAMSAFLAPMGGSFTSFSGRWMTCWVPDRTKTPGV
jgi:hypothetical protein